MPNLPPSIINNLFMFMYYTILKKQTYKTIENLDFNKLFDNMYQPKIITDYSDIKAYRYTLILPEENIKNRDTVTRLNGILELFYTRFKNIQTPLYRTCKIPKSSGGLRELSIPNDAFKAELSYFTNTLQSLNILEHDAAYAYVRTRCAADAVRKHQKNQSNWFLKLDLKDFFPSCTPEICMKYLMQVYPFALLDTEHQKLLKEILEIHAHNGLPQGSPLSPYLTNLIMVPIDTQLSQALMHYDKSHFVYTRYADDILISCKSKFSKEVITNLVAGLLKDFKINTEKIRFGSRAGRNWNLGVMLNKDNNITIGNQNKKLLQAMLHHFCKDFIDNQMWSPQDTQVLQGKLAYLRSIEPEYYEKLIEKYEKKFTNICISQALKTCITE